MNRRLRFLIRDCFPKIAITGGKVYLDVRGFSGELYLGSELYVGGKKTRIIACRRDKIIFEIPEDIQGESIYLKVGNKLSNKIRFNFGKRIATNLKNFLNPEIDKDNWVYAVIGYDREEISIGIVVKLSLEGKIKYLNIEVRDTVGITLGPDGYLYLSDQDEGKVFKVNKSGKIVKVYDELGEPTSIVFDREGNCYVGDKSGYIYKIDIYGKSKILSELIPSPYAYNMVIGPDNNLYLTAPSFTNEDPIYRILKNGEVEVFFNGFLKPQGLNFDRYGNLWVSGVYEGKEGIFLFDRRLHPNWIISGSQITGLNFTKNNDLIVATIKSLFYIRSEYLFKVVEEVLNKKQ